MMELESLWLVQFVEKEREVKERETEWDRKREVGTEKQKRRQKKT